jgi:hypothetical protein
LYSWAIITFLSFTYSTLFAQVQKDTIRTLKDTTRNALVAGDNEVLESIQKRKNEADSSRHFYEKLKRKFSKTRVTREIYRLLFREPYQNAPSYAVKQSTHPYEKYNGRIIGRIDITTLDPFGSRVTDTLRKADNWVEKTGNALHVSTKAYVIRKSLLFSKGEPLDYRVISDNERVLRQKLPFIQDARIYVLPRISNKDTVDILVLTQDNWSVSGDFAVGGFTSGNLKVDDKNIFGLGHEFLNEVTYNVFRNQKWGYRGFYRVPFIGKTFISGELSYINEWHQNIYGIRLRRDFLTPTTKFAGGVEVLQNRLLREVIPIGADTVAQRFHFSFNLADIWLGHSFPLNIGSEDFRGRTRIVLAGRVINNDFGERPPVGADTNQLYWNRFLSLVSLGISNRKYFRDVLIYGFGRTEDVPYGGMFSLTGGIESNEFGKRMYAGVKASRGKYINNFGYLVTSLDAGSFISNKRWEEGVLRVETNYFSRLFMLNTWRVRQFVNFRFTKGIGRFDTEFIDISNSNGIRGIGSLALRGTKSIVLNLETVFFTPVNILGFQIAGFTYADLGLITPTNVDLFAGKLFQGYGLGFRLRNENLTFNTFQFRLGYYPNIPNNPAVFRTQFSGIPSLRLNDFDIRAPETVNFGRRF